MFVPCGPSSQVIRMFCSPQQWKLRFQKEKHGKSPLWIAGVYPSWAIVPESLSVTHLPSGNAFFVTSLQWYPIWNTSGWQITWGLFGKPYQYHQIGIKTIPNAWMTFSESSVIWVKKSHFSSVTVPWQFHGMENPSTGMYNPYLVLGPNWINTCWDTCKPNFNAFHLLKSRNLPGCQYLLL